MNRFRRIKTTNRDLEAVQDNVAHVVEQLQTVPFLDGVWLVGVPVSTIQTVIAHTLNRQPRGWVVTDTNSTNGVGRVTWDNRTITLQSVGGTVTLSIWIF